MKTEKLQVMKRLFEKHSILMMNDICASFEGTAMRTIIRYLNEVGYYSSYNCKGKYYTITGIPKFDALGLWGFKEALFSLHGNLKETVCFQVDVSEAGMTNDELAAMLRVNTKNALTSLAVVGTITRIKTHGVYIYYSADPVRQEKQKQHRAASAEIADPNAEFNPYDIVGVLTAYIKGVRTPEQVAAHLRYKGHNISRSIIASIFECYALENDPGGKKNTF